MQPSAPSISGDSPNPHSPEYWNDRARRYHGDLRKLVAPHDTDIDAHETLVGKLLIGLLEPDQHVLDVACGYGRFAAFVRAARAQWTGLDFSGEMMRLWSEHVRWGEFIRADHREPPPDLGRYDLLLYVGGHKFDADSLVARFRPFMKPGAHALLSWSDSTRILRLI